MGFLSSLSKGLSSFLGSGDLFTSILGGISGVASSRQDRRIAEAQIQGALRNTREQGRESRRTAEFEMALADWARRNQLQERRRGLSNFNRFSQEDFGTPSYIPEEVGDRPTASSFDDSYYDQSGDRRNIGTGLASAIRSNFQGGP
jgi:hypothetical protein